MMRGLRAILGGAKGAAPRITGTGGRVIQGAAANPGVANAGGGLLATYGTYELLNAILGGLGNVGNAVSRGSQAVPTVISGGAPDPAAQQTARGYTLPMESPQAYQQNYQSDMYRRALLQALPGGGGLQLGVPPAVPLTQSEAFNMNQEAVRRAGIREQLIERIKGELLAAQQGFGAQGQTSQALGNVAAAVVPAVVQNPNVAGNQALAALARTNQFN